MRSPHPFLQLLALAVSLAFAGTLGLPPTAAAEPPPCQNDPAFAELDFWLGDWEVRVEDRVVGTNRIEKVLSGCALMEHWAATEGGQGKSLFYYDPVQEEWNQIWLTEDTTRPGGLKEKRLVERLDDGGVRFQGEVSHPDRGSYLDRTTLTPLPGDRVRQVIEISADRGKTWRAVWDALYLRRQEAAAASACGPIEGITELPVQPVLLFGEIHGTDLGPAAFGDVVCHLARQHGEVVVGLEVSRREQERIEAFLASTGATEDRESLITGEFWRSPYQDGRQSRAMVALLETLRTLRGSGARIRVVAFDPLPDVEPRNREEGMARILLEARREHPDPPFAVLTGNLHARTERPDPDFVPMGARLEAAGVEVFPVDVRHAGGSAWICTGSSAEDCGPHSIAGPGDPRSGPALEQLEEPETATGYAGVLWVGEIEASPPVVKSSRSPG